MRLVSGGRIQPDILALVCANSRTGDERRGDLAAQAAANLVGERRFIELAQRYGIDEFTQRQAEARQHASAMVRAVLSSVRPGEYGFEDFMESDGAGQEDLAIRVTASIRDGAITFDFTGTAPETTGPINAPEAVTRSACYYVLRCLVDEEIPMNAGTFEAVRVIAPEGTLVNARFPRAVAAGNVETSQRIVDVLLGALASAFPDRIPAASQGTMNNLLIGGSDPIRGGRYAYYETICGGAGASPAAEGTTAIHSHMTNTRNTPIEALEMHFPLRVRQYAIRAGSGGRGEHAGGDGVARTIELLAPAHVSILSERRSRGPWGMAGGADGTGGLNLIDKPGEPAQAVAAKFSGVLPAGTIVTVETPGGGGYGDERADGKA